MFIARPFGKRRRTDIRRWIPSITSGCIRPLAENLRSEGTASALGCPFGSTRAWKFSGRQLTDRGRTAHRNDRALHVAPTHRSRRKGIEDGQARMVRRPVRRRHPSACHIRRGSCRRRARNSGRRRVAPRSLDLARQIWRAAW
jgi:hypothetical protein